MAARKKTRTRRPLGARLYWSPQDGYYHRWQIPADLRALIPPPHDRVIRLDADTDKAAKVLNKLKAAELAALVHRLRSNALQSLASRADAVQGALNNVQANLTLTLSERPQAADLNHLDAFMARAEAQAAADYALIAKHASEALEKRAKANPALASALKKAGGAAAVFEAATLAKVDLYNLKLQIQAHENTAADTEEDDETALQALRAAREARAALAEVNKAHEEATQIIAKASPTKKPPAVRARLLSAVDESRCRLRALKPSSLRKAKDYRNRFVDIIGDLPVEQITAEHVRTFRDTLMELPKAHSLTSSLRRKVTIEELKATEGPRLSPASVTKAVNWIQAVLNFAAEEGLIDINRAANVKPPKANKKKSESKQAFTPDQMREIRDLMEKHWRTGSPKQVCYYWLTRLAMHTGARLGEIGQLRRHDIREHKGLWVVEFTDRDDEQTLKTDQSLRVIPLPQSLLDLGFLGWFNAIKTDALFAAMDTGEKGDTGPYGERASKMFAAQILARCDSLKDPSTGKRDSRVSFHSFRHRWIAAARKARIDADHRKAIVGHADGDAHANYGGAFAPATLKPSMDAVDVFAD